MQSDALINLVLRAPARRSRAAEAADEELRAATARQSPRERILRALELHHRAKALVRLPSP